MHHLVLSVEEGLHFSTVPPILGTEWHPIVVLVGDLL